MAYNVSQITTLMNDVIEDLTGQNSSISTLDTTDLVSVGKAIANAGLTEGFFGALCNRLAKTVYMIRLYEPSVARSILRDEHEFGAFVQKVYYTAPAVVDNPEYNIPTALGAYTQTSPYDVSATVSVSAKIFDSQGTFAIEIIRPVDQIRSAFLSEAEMMKFIDGIYVAVENKLKLAEEGLVSTAVVTAMAYDINAGLKRNLLSEYNTKFTETLTVSTCMEDADFLRYAAMEIQTAIENMGSMSTEFNAGGYLTFTDKDNVVVEMLSRAAASFDTYLQADTFHDNLLTMPKYEKVARWQYMADDTVQALSDVSSIKVEHDDINSGTAVAQSGIICFVHDIEHVAAYFGHRRSWEFYNQRDDIFVHGETVRKGYAVDPNANGLVFYVANS